MKKAYLRFLALVLGLLLFETVLLYLTLRFVPRAGEPVFALVLATILFLLIPVNLFLAWRLTMRQG